MLQRSCRTIWDLLHQEAQRGAAVLVTTHYMDEAERCPRLVLLYRGRVLATGSPQERAEFRFAHLPLEEARKAAGPGGGGVFVRLLSTRFGLGYLGSLSLGPWGFLAYGLQGEVGEGGWGGAVYATGRAAWLLEGSYALRQGALLGAGLFPSPYALLGYRDGIRDLTLRLGGINRLEAGLYLGEASLFLILSYPFSGSVGAWLGDLGLEMGFEKAPYAWVRYAWRWP